MEIKWLKICHDYCKGWTDSYEELQMDFKKGEDFINETRCNLSVNLQLNN